MKANLSILAVLFIIFTSAAHAEPSEGGFGGKRHGLGFASISTGVGNSTVLTGWIPFKPSMGIQAYLGIPTTAGSFNFLAGGAFKATVAGNSQAAIHVGGNLLMGAVASNFTVAFGGLAGAHFNIAPSVLFSVDGGPQLTIIGGTANFSLGALSSLLGASLMFLF
jgi:hypothetical protein